MGFGHRVYKNYDPRARIIQQHMDEVFEATEYNPLVEIARELEKRALDDEYFTSRKLYPNVDFYSGIIYEALEIPTDMFTVIFAIPRTAGWVAQWMEMQEDPEQKIARPRQIYTGEREREYVRDRGPRGAGENRRAAGAPAETAAARSVGAGEPVTAASRLRRAALPMAAAAWLAPRWKLTVRHGSDVEHAASTISGRRWRRCGSGRWRFGPRGRRRPVSLAAGLRAARTRSTRGCSWRPGPAAQAGRRGRRARRRHVHALPRRRRAARSSIRATTRRRSTWCARLWKRRTDERPPSTEIPKGSYAAGERVKLPAGAEAALHGLHQRGRAERGRRLRGRGRRDRLHPPDRQGEDRHRPLAGDVPGPLRHLPQERDDRPPVPPRRQGRAASPTCRSSPTTPRRHEHRLRPALRPQRGRQRQALPDRRRLERPAPARAAARVVLPHRPRHRRRLARDQQPARARGDDPGPRRGRARRGPDRQLRDRPPARHARRARSSAW